MLFNLLRICKVLVKKATLAQDRAALYYKKASEKVSHKKKDPVFLWDG